MIINYDSNQPFMICLIVLLCILGLFGVAQFITDVYISPENGDVFGMLGSFAASLLVSFSLLRRNGASKMTLVNKLFAGLTVAWYAVGMCLMYTLKTYSSLCEN